jgi:two-component system sensor histidine kinase DesK
VKPVTEGPEARRATLAEPVPEAPAAPGASSQGPVADEVDGLAGTLAPSADMEIEDLSDRKIASAWSARNWSRFVLMAAATVWACVMYVSGHPPWWAVVVAITLGVLTSALGVITRFMSDDLPVRWGVAFGTLVVLTLGLAAWAGPEWTVNMAWATAAAGWRRGARIRPIIVGLGIAAGLVALARGADVGMAAILAGFVLLPGMFSAQARRSAELIGELQETRRELARLAIVEERNRIARDLHDLVGHSLSVVAVKNELGRRLLRVDLARAEAEFDDIDMIVRRALSEVRQAVTNYRQPMLAAELSSAVQAAAAAGIDCQVTSPGSWDLPAPVEGLLAWTVREGITNVLRHSGASSCDIALSLTPVPAIEIVDNGPGASGQDRPGNGLIGLSERARALRGALTAGRREEGGFRLRVEAPREGA